MQAARHAGKARFHLRVVEVGRCRSWQQRRCDDDGEHRQDRCHVCRARAVLRTQRDDLSGADCTGRRTRFQPATPTAGWRAGYKVALTEEAAVVVPVYTPKPPPHPPSSVTPPQVRWTFAASSLFPKESTSQKLNHSPGCYQQSTPPVSKESGKKCTGLKKSGRWKGETAIV